MQLLREDMPYERQIGQGGYSQKELGVIGGDLPGLEEKWGIQTEEIQTDIVHEDYKQCNLQDIRENPSYVV